MRFLCRFLEANCRYPVFFPFFRQPTRRMDAIKKKMQAMKVEKDNAMDRSDVCEQQAKEAKIRAAKAEEEVSICLELRE